MRVERIPEELIPADLPGYYLEHHQRYAALLAKRRSDLQVSTPDTTDPLHAKRVKATVDLLFLMAQQGFKSVLEIGSGPGGDRAEGPVVAGGGPEDAREGRFGGGGALQQEPDCAVIPAGEDAEGIARWQKRPSGTARRSCRY